MTAELGPGERPSTFLVGEPDSSGTTVTISEASKRSGISISTLRRRLAKGQIPGAHKAPGPDGEEWRIPVASIPEPSDNQPDSSTDDLRRELDDALRRAEKAEKDAEDARNARDQLARSNEGLLLAIEALNRALPPAPSPTPQPIEQEPRRAWFRKKAPKPTA